MCSILGQINFKKKIEQVRSGYVYNFSFSADKAVEEIVRIKEEGTL